MSNISNMLRDMSRDIRGKSRNSSRSFRSQENVRKRQQVIFEQDDELLKSLGGPIGDPTTLKKGQGLMKSKKKQRRFVAEVQRRLLKQSMLSNG